MSALSTCSSGSSCASYSSCTSVSQCATGNCCGYNYNSAANCASIASQYGISMTSSNPSTSQVGYNAWVACQFTAT